MHHFLKKYAFILSLLALSLLLCINNYIPGTFLSGWDTLHPEFNFGLNFQRLIFSVFRTEQGLGAVAGHSQMADLPRVFFLYFMHFIAPLSFLRYSYIFASLIAGPVGMYLLLKRFIFAHSKHAATISFLGALFYLLNLGTMQQFIVPFEMFTTQYAALPWIFYATFLYFKKSNPKHLLFFCLIMLLASPMAYAATLWHVFFALFIVFLVTCHFVDKKLVTIPKIIELIGFTLIVNSYWLLPNLYFIFNHGTEVSLAAINELFSPQAFLYNKEFSTPLDILQLKTFYFDWKILTPQQHFTNLLDVWIQHLSNPFVFSIGLGFSGLALSGVIYSIYKKISLALAFLPMLLLSLFFLMTVNAPTGFLYALLQQHLPLFKEALRFPDDKILGVFVFLFAIYVAYGYLALLNFSQKLPCKKHFPAGIIVASTLLLVVYMWPAFTGNLIQPLMRINIPKQYFSLYSYMNSQKDSGRAADLPINSFWGWEYYNWYGSAMPSYQGAGFLWFGMKQPLLNRDFDRWSSDNEEYYREMSYAVYTQNQTLLSAVLKKYNIQYFILDTSEIAPENDPNTLFYKQIKKLLANNPNVYMSKSFNFIYVYKVRQATVQNTSGIIKNPANVLPTSSDLTTDQAYLQLGDYTSNQTQNAINYPLRVLSNNQGQSIPSLTDTNTGIELSLPQNTSVTSNYLSDENTLPATVLVVKQNNTLHVSLYPVLPSGQQYPPLTTDISLPSNSAILSVNNDYLFLLQNLVDNTPLSLGNVSLKTKTSNTFNMFDTSTLTQTPLNIPTTSYSVEPCDSKSSTQAFGINIPQTTNNLTLFAKNTPLCMMIPLKKILINQATSSNFLIKTSYTYVGKTYPSLCFANIVNGNCISYSLLGNSPLQQGHAYTNYAVLDTKQNQQTGIKIFFDTSYNNTIEKEAFGGLTLSLTTPVATSQATLSTTPAILPVTGNTITLLYSGDPTASKDITQLPKTNGSCSDQSPLSSPDIFKQIIKEQGNNLIRYTALLGSLCDHFSYPTLSQKQGYIIQMTARNLEGLPITLCVTNDTTKRCDLYTTLSSNKNFTTDSFILPPMNTTNGFDVNISSLGIKGSPSINELKSITIVPLPYTYATSLSDATSFTKSTQQQIKTISYNSLLYSSTIPTVDNKDVLALSQTYEAGWNAYKVSSINPLTLTLPFIFGDKLPHTIVDNWENGWELNSSTSNQQVVMIFLPQYLEYLGLLFGLLSFLFLLITVVKKKLMS